MRTAQRLTLGIDVGTTSSKAALLDEQLAVAGTARVEHQVFYPRPGFVEQDASVWWRDVQQLTRELSRSVDLAAVKAVGISSMGPTIVPLSKAGEPLRNAILYGVDSRAAGEIDFLNASMADRARSHTFTPYSTQSLLPKYLWLKRNEPEIYARTHSFLTTSGYVVFRLTGQRTLDRFSGSAGCVVDLATSGLYQESFDVAGVDAGLVPPLKWSVEEAGTVTAGASEATGLPAGIPVTVGTTDAAADALACGCVHAGDGAASLGGTTIFVVTSDRLTYLENIFVCSHVSPGSYIYGGGTSSGGTLFEWLAGSLLGVTPKEMFARFDGLRFRKTGMVFLPYLNGARTPVNDVHARGLLTGLGPRTSAEDIYLTLLESLAFDMCQIIDTLERGGLPVNRVRIEGGGARNALLLQIIAEVLGKDIEALAPETGAAVGDAIMARRLLGEESLEQLVSRIPVAARIPHTGSHDAYFSAKKALFQRVYSDNAAAFRDMDGIAAAD
jgi:xylulokinase